MLYAIKTKEKGSADSKPRALTTDGLSLTDPVEINIDQALDDVKNKLSDVLSLGVLKHFGLERTETNVKPNIEYSLRPAQAVVDIVYTANEMLNMV